MELIGDFIFPFIEEMSNDELAPKITGMIIDLPFEDLQKVVSDYTELDQKIKEGMNLIRQEN